MTLLTVGLLVFAGVQVYIQNRNENARKAERRADRDDAIDRAFHLTWAEHFRLDSLANQLNKRDLIEMSVLGVLRSEDVLPRDWAEVTKALSSLSREAGFLGGVANTLAHDLAHQIALFNGSVRGFASGAPSMSDAARVEWIQARHRNDLTEWETSIRNDAKELALLMWDASIHNPRANVSRTLAFSDDMTSRIGKIAVQAIAKRANEGEALGPGARQADSP